MQVNKMATFDVTIPAGTTLYTSIANRNACVHVHDMRDVEVHDTLFYTYPYFAIRSTFDFDDEPGMASANWQVAVYTLKTSLTVSLGRALFENFDRAYFEPNDSPYPYWSESLQIDAPRTNGFIYIPHEECTHRLLKLSTVYNVADKQRFENFASQLATLTGNEIFNPVDFGGYHWDSWQGVAYNVDPHIMAGVLQPVRCGAPNRQDAADYPLVGLPLVRVPSLEGGNATLQRLRQRK
jgi:hypothetical protein